MQVILTTLFASVMVLSLSQYAIASIMSTGTICRPDEHPQNVGYSRSHLEFNQGETILRADYGSEVIRRSTDEISENGDISQSKRRSDRANLELSYENDAFFQYLTLEWKRSLYIPLGQTVTLFASSRGELYQNKVLNDFSPEERKGTVSLDPQTGIEWAGPSLTLWEAASLVFQPSGKLIASTPNPIGDLDHHIGGVDVMSYHRGFEPDDTQGLMRSFNADPFLNDEIRERGHYLIGGEVRAPLGSLGDLSVKGEQKYFLTTHQNAMGDQVPVRSFSDIIGRIEANFSEGAMLNGEIKLNQYSLKPTLSNVGISIGPEIANLSLNYAVIDDHFTSSISDDFQTDEVVIDENLLSSVVNDFEKDEVFDIPSKKPTKQVSLFFNSQITPKWSFESSLTKDVQKTKQKESKSFQYGTGFHYHNNHLRVSFTVSHQFFPFMGSKPDTLFMVRFGLRSACPDY